MKRILLLILFSSFSLCSFAQKSAISNAKEAISVGDIERAKEYIDKAVENHKTSDKAETYLIQSFVYSTISQDDKYSIYPEDPISIALNSYYKALEIENSNNKKTLDSIDIEKIKNSLYVSCYNKAVFYNKKEMYKEAMDYFILASDLNKNELFLYLNIGLVAAKVNDSKTEIAAFQKLVDNKYTEEVFVYSRLAELYYNGGDYASAEKIYNIANDLFPNNRNIISNEVSFYIKIGKSKDLVSKLEAAVSVSPTNKLYHLMLGMVYEKQDMTEEAISQYKEAIKIDSLYFDAYFNLGALFYNKAIDIVNEANKLPASQQYEYMQAIEEFKKYSQLALPHLIKANEIDPTYLDVYVPLKEIYARTGNLLMYQKVNDKYKEELDKSQNKR